MSSALSSDEAMMEIERMLDWSLADDPVPEDEARPRRKPRILWVKVRG